MKKNKKLVFTILAVIIITIIAIIGITNKEKNTHSLDELKEQKIQLESQRHDTFLKNGFSEEYYRLDSELNEINEQIQKKEFSSGPAPIFFTIFGLIFVTIFGTVIITIFKAIKNPHSIKDNVTVNDHTTDQMEKMASMLGKVAVDMAKEMNPEYKSLKCPNCGAALTDDVEVCEYCDAPLTKVVATKSK